MMECDRPVASAFFPDSPTNVVKDQVEASEQKDLSIIWFDDPLSTVIDNTQKTIAELKRLVANLRVFDNADECVEYVSNIKDLRILLIVGESNGAQIVRRVRYISKLKTVYILCFDRSIHPPWVTGCKPLKCIFVDHVSIYERIEIDTRDSSFTWDVIDTSSISLATLENSNKQEVEFMYSQLFKHILTEMSYSDDHMNNMIKFFEENRPRDIEKIKEFQVNALETPIWCYTNYAFLYTTLNEALRTSDAYKLYIMGIFIQALHQEIVKLHKVTTKPEILKLYRGQIIPSSTFENIKSKVGRLLSINNFLSTSSNEYVARMFTEGTSFDDTSVLFEIIIDHSMSTTVSYACIQSLSRYSDEEEYLFTMGSVFRIESVEKPDEKGVWRVRLTLTSGNDPELIMLTDYLRSQIQQPSPMSLGLVMLYMGKFEKIVEICETEIKISHEISYLCSLHETLGSAYFGMGYYEKGFVQLELALDYSRQLPDSGGKSLIICLTRSLMYIQQWKLDLALTNAQTVLENVDKFSNLKDQKDMLIRCNVLMGMIFYLKQQIADALSYQTKAYNMAKEYLPSTHPMIGECLQQLAMSYEAQGQKDEALLCLQEAIKIQQDSIPAEHVSAVASQWLYYTTLRSCNEYHSLSESQAQCWTTNFHKWKSASEQNPTELLIHAHICVLKNNIDDGLSILEQYFKIQRENTVSLQNHVMVAAYDLKAKCHFRKGNKSAAVQSMRQANEIETQYFEQGDPRLAARQLYIATKDVDQNKYDEVLTVVERYKYLFFNESKNSAPRMGRESLNLIALQFYRKGLHCIETEEYDEALTHLQNCLKIQAIFLPSDHSDVADTYDSIAFVHLMKTNYSDALFNYENTLNIRQKCLSPNDPKIVDTWKMMKIVYSQLKQHDDALFACNKYLEILQNTHPQDYIEVAGTYVNIGLLSVMQQRFSDAIESYQRALDIRIKHLSPTDSKIIDCWVYLEQVYRCMNRHEDALNALQNVLDIRAIILPPNHIDIAHTHKSIALHYGALGAREESLDHFQKCLDIQMSSLPPDHLDLAEIHLYIGQVFYALENFAEALRNHQRALDIQLQHELVNPLDITKNWLCLGEDYDALGEYEQSISGFNQCLEIQLNVLSSNQIDIADTHKKIALVYQKTAQYKEAVLQFQKCLDIQVNTLIPDHLDLTNTQLCIGDALSKLENFSSALSYYQCALDIQLKHLPTTNMAVVKNLQNLGITYFRLHRFEDSIHAYNQCLEIQFNILPSDHIDIAFTYKRLGFVYKLVGKYEDALSNFQKCLDIQIISLPSDDLELAKTQSLLGDVFSAMKQFFEASHSYQRALDIQFKHLPTTSLELIGNLKKLGKTYSELRRYENAISAYDQCLEIQFNILPSKHLDMAFTHNDLGIAYFYIGKYEEALFNFQASLDIRKNSLPSDHPLLVNTQSLVDKTSRILISFSTTLSGTR